MPVSNQPDAIEAATSKSPSIDAEHRIQTGLLDALCDAVQEVQSDETIMAILLQLIAYSEAHFMSEEMLMRLASYDDYEDHVADHDRMLSELQEIAERQRKGHSDLTMSQAKSALAFLLQHIETRDKHFQNWKRD